jgi:hypothetical protein
MRTWRNTSIAHTESLVFLNINPIKILLIPTNKPYSTSVMQLIINVEFKKHSCCNKAS